MHPITCHAVALLAFCEFTCALAFVQRKTFAELPLRTRVLVLKALLESRLVDDDALGYVLHAVLRACRGRVVWWVSALVKPGVLLC